MPDCVGTKRGFYRKHMGCKRWRGPINENMIIVFLRLNTLLVCQDKRQIQAKSIKSYFFPKPCLRTNVKPICNGTLRRSKYGILAKKDCIILLFGTDTFHKLKIVKKKEEALFSVSTSFVEVLIIVGRKDWCSEVCGQYNF